MFCLNCLSDTGSDAPICPKCGNSIPQMYGNTAQEYVSYLFLKPSIIASLSTGPGLIVNLDGKQTHFAGVTDEASSLREIEKLLWIHPRLQDEDFSRIENPMREDIGEARMLLTEQVLPKGRSATFRDKRKVINLMGTALDMQTGVDTLAYEKRGSDRIVPRLILLQVPETMKADYESVHKYYNATKHSNRAEYSVLLCEISSEPGCRIAAKYFEYVRRILEWYYTTNNLDLIPELYPFDPWGYDLSRD